MSEKEKTTESAAETDWKAIAIALAQRVNFAVTNCECKGGLMNLETGQASGWRDYMVEAIEMIPGITVDREILATLHLPLAKRQKAQVEIRKRRAAAPALSSAAAL